MGLFSKKWSPKGKTCVVTGGSQGLGLSTAKLLARKGANVIIVARNVEKLEAAVQELEKERQNEQQRFKYLSFELNSLAGAEGATAAAWEFNGGAPDAFFLCAGSATPMYFIEASEQDLVKSMEQAFWVQAFSARAISKKLVQDNKKGKIAFVGSTVSHMGLIGYAPYAPGKYALKGLAESLRSEFKLYGIDIHILFAPTMHTPGFDVEQQTKPSITKKIEEDDVPVSPDKAAKILVNGVEAGQYQMGGNILADIFAASSRGAAPASNALFTPILDGIAWIAIPVWRMLTDRMIKKSAQEHRAYLAGKKVVE
ncbi:NAD(P)-binding protein [Schizopora paradoxa]|uniref:3-dehydrosphinganine reductase n=1 Tax=Schizopora paradoxa TaxID=27342 RepID=A0A0H2S8S7_9AGAM|nr:NAD(P)-binding protein [Schizopora paradoxa]